MGYMYSHGIFQNPVLNTDFIDEGEDYHMQKCSRIVHEYCSKNLSYSSDTLNACRAVLNRLEGEGFSQGFLWGLPLDRLTLGLLWTCPNNPMRRRDGFHSWSRVGWIGGFQEECWRRGTTITTKYSPPLHVWAYKSNIRTLVLEIFKGMATGQYGGLRPIRIHHDRIRKINSDLECSEWKLPQFNLEDCTDVEREKLLLMQGLIYNMIITKFDIRSTIHAVAFTKVNGVYCMIHGHTMNTMLHLTSGHNRLLLMRRGFDGQEASIFELLVVKWQASNVCG